MGLGGRRGAGGFKRRPSLGRGSRHAGVGRLTVGTVNSLLKNNIFFAFKLLSLLILYIYTSIIHFNSFISIVLTCI
jgi:hypothetical protein